MFKWKKLGHLFNPSERKYAEWMNEFAQAPSVLIFDVILSESIFLADRSPTTTVNTSVIRDLWIWTEKIYLRLLMSAKDLF